MAKVDKAIKSIVKQVEKRMKKLARDMRYVGEVQFLCQIGKHKDYAKNGNVVLVHKGAVHFVEDVRGTYVKCKGKFVPVSEYGDTTPSTKKYLKSQDADVLYMYFGDRWVKVS